MIFAVFLFTLFNFFSLKPVFAHPGKTASDGCHYCRTNCSKWGEVEGERHCHGGAEPVKEAVVAPPAPKVSVLKPSLKPIQVSTPKPASSSKPPAITVKCSAATDSKCPAHCNAGNDADCCTSKLRGYSWYENWGCYPTKLSCSATADNVCDTHCTAGNDADCCSQTEGYTWYDNWGCYPVQ